MVSKAKETPVALTQVSERKQAANRLNAQKSTGPRTVAGKAKSKGNAMKHGLLSKAVVVESPYADESEAEFETLHAQLREDYDPQGIQEELMVQQIAVCWWKKRRALRCETGEIRKALVSAGWRETFEQEKRFSLEKRSLLSSESGRWEMKRSSRGIRHLIDVLEEIRNEVGITGYIDEERRKKLVENFGIDFDDRRNGFTLVCYIYTIMATKGLKRLGQAPDNHDYHLSLSPKECRRILLRLIDGEKRKFERLQKDTERIERLELDAKLASLALPSREEIEKILRYETAIDRQLYRAMGELERLQRQRRGEAVLPPIKVELSGQD